MEAISIFDIYKIGVGPSSSHTLGPWKAALDFIGVLNNQKIDRIKISLYGSLSKTGKGHCTDIAIQLGLCGFHPESIDPSSIDFYIGRIASTNRIQINALDVKFNPQEDVLFSLDPIKTHPNTMKIQAFHFEEVVAEQVYFSIGGGFIEKEREQTEEDQKIKLPLPVQNAKDLLTHTENLGKNISDIVLINELFFQTKSEIKKKIHNIFETMVECTYRGCSTSGILPGGLNVKRRAKKMCDKLLNGKVYNNSEEWMNAIKNSKKDFETVNKWISCFALAVNEENADLGRVVTSPTNGAAGVIPAVLLYYYIFCENEGFQDVQKFFLTSGEIGCIFKKGATISAAVGGCQAEIGVSSAMAAAGLTEVRGGTPAQAMMAAEIAMEHHLGMTCDPIAGLVQIPCIERNTMGAIKAITACNLALSGDPLEAKIDLDVVIKTMWDTAQEMNSKFKETSEGGLAINLPVVYPEC
jgi:L-serine dehydratase